MDCGLYNTVNIKCLDFDNCTIVMWDKVNDKLANGAKY